MTINGFGFGDYAINSSHYMPIILGLRNLTAWLYRLLCGQHGGYTQHLLVA